MSSPSRRPGEAASALRRRSVALTAVALLLLAAAAAATVAAAAWFGPGMLSGERYRSLTEAAASSALGRPVRIAGPITLALLPRPVLTASGVTVAEAGDGVSLSAGELRLQVAAAPLLAGRLEPQTVFLRDASLRLPWPITGLSTRRPPAWLRGFRAQVEDSRVQIGDFPGGDFEVSAIDGELAADGLGGLSATGAAQVMGRSWRVTVRVGNPGGDGAATLEASLDGQGVAQDTGGTFSGQVAADGDLAGQIDGRGRDLSLLLTAPAVPWRAAGQFKASGGLLAATDLALDIGGAPARGAAALRLSPALRLDVAIAASRLDLDAWLPRLLHQAPPGIPTRIDLSAEVATLAGGTLRRVHAESDAGPDGGRAGKLDALLPGDAALHWDGQVRDGQWQGTAKLDAADLRPAVRWLRQSASAWAGALPDALAQASLTAGLTANAGSVTVDNLAGTLNGATVGGSAVLSLDARPSVTARLTLDGLTLDPWLAAPSADPPDIARRLADAPQDHGFDADFVIDLPHATWSGQRLDTLTLDGRAVAGLLDVRRLQASGPGFGATVSGQLAAGGRISDGVADLAMPDASLLVGLLPDAAALLHGPAALHAAFGGSPEALGVAGDLDLGDLRAGGNFRIDLPKSHAAGQLTLLHPGATRLAHALGVDVPWLGEGSLSLRAEFDATPGTIGLDQAELSAGALRAGFAAAFDRSAHPMLSGTVDADTLPLPPFAFRSQEPLPVAWLRGFDAALHIRANHVLAGFDPLLEHAEADLTLRQAAAAVHLIHADGDLSFDAVFDAAKAPPALAVTGRAAKLAIAEPLFGTPVDVTGGLMGAALQVSATGYSPSALVATMAGTGTVTIEDGALSGLDANAAAAALATPADAEAAVRAALSGGVTRFTQLDATAKLAGGVAALGPVTIRLTGGTLSADGTIDLTGGSQSLHATVDAGNGLPPVSLQLDGPPEHPRRTIELARLARWLAERPTAN